MVSPNFAVSSSAAIIFVCGEQSISGIGGTGQALVLRPEARGGGYISRKRNLQTKPAALESWSRCTRKRTLAQTRSVATSGGSASVGEAKEWERRGGIGEGADREYGDGDVEDGSGRSTVETLLIHTSHNP